MTKHSYPFCYLIYHLCQFFILFFVELVHFHKMGTLNVPMEIPGLGVKHKFIRQQFIQFNCYGL
ncbi:MAG: hypothetical protein AUG74_17705 [Bacteroidetes bacterium 13_1_20CM_4_60_6]|nr:MAG: hypothetical protein AUG74_17705 [Bacteroidetes bacterium 13_1_20CM_4_60_6]